MVASVCPGAKVTVPELGEYSCPDAPPPESSPVVHGTLTVPFTDKVSLTGNCTLEPSVTEPSGS